MARNKLCKHTLLYIYNFATTSQPNDSSNIILSCGVVCCRYVRDCVEPAIKPGESVIVI